MLNGIKSIIHNHIITKIVNQQCEMLRLRFEEMEREKQSNEHTLSEKHNTISRLVSHARAHPTVTVGV